MEMNFGQKIRKLRKSKGWTLRELAGKLGIGFTYLSRIENGCLTFGDYPSTALIGRLATELEANEEELVLMAQRIPELIRKRVLERPDVFCLLAKCNDATLDNVIAQVKHKNKN